MSQKKTKDTMGKFSLCHIHDEAYYESDGCPGCNEEILRRAVALGSIEMAIIEAGLRTMMRDKPYSSSIRMNELLLKVKHLNFSLTACTNHKKFEE